MGNDQSRTSIGLVQTPQRSDFEISLRAHLQHVLITPDYDDFRRDLSMFSDEQYFETVSTDLRRRSEDIHYQIRIAMEDIRQSAAGTPPMTIGELIQLRKFYIDKLYKLTIIKLLQHHRSAIMIIQRPNLLIVPLEYRDFKTKQINLARQRLGNSKVEQLAVEEKDNQPAVQGVTGIDNSRTLGFRSRQELQVFLTSAETPNPDGEDDTPYQAGDRLRRRNATEEEEIWTILSRTLYITQSGRRSYTYMVRNQANTMRVEWSHDGIRDRNLVIYEESPAALSSSDAEDDEDDDDSAAGDADQFPDDEEQPPVIDLADAENIAYEARIEAEAAGVKCAICLNNFTAEGIIEAADLPEAEHEDQRQRFFNANQDYYTVKLNCEHYFHAACIRNMQSTDDFRCPFCRVTAQTNSIPDGILRLKTKLRF